MTHDLDNATGRGVSYHHVSVLTGMPVWTERRCTVLFHKLTAISIVASIAILTVLPTPVPAAPPGATDIIKYTPPLTVAQTLTETQEGNCWVGSIAATRPDAYRCMVGNEIHDPCFLLPGGTTAQCGMDPTLNRPGFLLKLTGPAPTPEPMTPDVTDEYAKSGWLIALSDGTVCSPATGAMGTAGGMDMHYYCRGVQPPKEGDFGPVLLGDLITDQPTWMALEAQLAPPGATGELQIEMSKTVAISTVWQ
jgi:hypothetical protein